MHPVVNDVTLKMWHNMGIICWPTLIMLGNKHNYEIIYDLLTSFF